MTGIIYKTRLKQPARLHVKQQALTCKKYFGVTIKENIDEYIGSGPTWNEHVKEHGIEHIITWWVSDWFYFKEEINELAMHYSKLWDIVKSPDWMNKIAECGISPSKELKERIYYCSKCERPSNEDYSGCHFENCSMR